MPKNMSIGLPHRVGGIMAHIAFFLFMKLDLRKLVYYRKYTKIIVWFHMVFTLITHQLHKKVLSLI